MTLKLENIYIIKKAVLDLNNFDPDKAFTYEPIGFVTDFEDAKTIVNEGGKFTEFDGWVIPERIINNQSVTKFTFEIYDKIFIVNGKEFSYSWGKRLKKKLPPIVTQEDRFVVISYNVKDKELSQLVDSFKERIPQDEINVIVHNIPEGIKQIFEDGKERE